MSEYVFMKIILCMFLEYDLFSVFDNNVYHIIVTVQTYRKAMNL